MPAIDDLESYIMDRGETQEQVQPQTLRKWRTHHEGAHAVMIDSVDQTLPTHTEIGRLIILEDDEGSELLRAHRRLSYEETAGWRNQRALKRPERTEWELVSGTNEYVERYG